MRVSIRHLGAVIAGPLLALGCSTGDDRGSGGPTAPVVQLGAPGETNRVVTSQDAGPTVTYSALDVTFMQEMIGHHRQALEMTALIDGRSDRDAITRLGERITVAQTDEIAQMESWLTSRGETVPEQDDHGEHAAMMPGMLTDAELDQLGAATGDDFDTLLLQYMIRHHEGAIRMAQTLTDAGGAQESEAFQISQAITSDQSVEVSRMKSMLAD